jgi:hypothetical protein
VTEQLAAHHVLIVHVETRRLDEARAIARTIVDPILPREHYAEILIYFHRPGRPDPLAPRRVQWTPRNGYVETVYAPEPGASERPSGQRTKNKGRRTER